jgi:hypothetical protein
MCDTVSISDGHRLGDAVPVHVPVTHGVGDTVALDPPRGAVARR